MAFKFYKETKIGITVTVAMIFLLWGFNFLKGKNLLTRNYIYYAVYERIEGLTESSPVYLHGFKVGLVDEVYLDKKNINNIIVKFIVSKEVNIPQKSIARIVSSDLMGSKSIKLILSDNQLFCSSGDTLLSEVEADLAEQVSIQMLPLKTKAESLMKEMQEAIEVVKLIFNEETRENLSISIRNIKSAINQINSTTVTLDSLMQTEKTKLANIFTNIESITRNLKNNNEQIAHVINNLSNISDSIAKANVLSTLNTIESSFNQISSITSKINSGEGSLSQLLNNDTLYHNLEAASKNLEYLIEDIKSNPKKYLHFSVVDMGKTIYQVDDKKIKVRNKKSD